jgi:hypothetical protein
MLFYYYQSIIPAKIGKSGILFECRFYELRFILSPYSLCFIQPAKEELEPSKVIIPSSYPFFIGVIAFCFNPFI